jgi:peptidoglycan hydrolase-like protein with peptidoglycan-binding domain
MLTAAYLGDRLAGSPAYNPCNPDPALSLDDMKALQSLLETRGYDVGKIDGVLGSGTREAIRQEQMRLGLLVDGWPTAELLAKLERKRRQRSSVGDCRISQSARLSP